MEGRSPPPLCLTLPSLLLNGGEDGFMAAVWTFFWTRTSSCLSWPPWVIMEVGGYVPAELGMTSLFFSNWSLVSA